MEQLKQQLWKQKLLRNLTYSGLILLFIGLCTPPLFAVQAGDKNSTGQIFVVNTESDAVDANINDGICDIGDGSCSLRAAIQEANATTGLDEIQVENNVNRIVLTGGAFTINTPINISKAIDSPLLIDGNQQGRIFTIGGLMDIEVTLRNMVLQDGKTTEIAGQAFSKFGGAILVKEGGHLILLNVNISNCVSEEKGGGIANFGSLTAINCRFSNNETGIDDGNSGSGGSLRNNVVPSSFGGAIYNGGGIIDITNLDVLNNVATQGGGIFINGGQASIVNSTISRNHALDEGGGLNIIDITNLDILNSIFALNEDDANTAPDVFFRSNNAGSINVNHNLVAIKNGSSSLFSLPNNNIIGTIAQPIDPLFQDVSQNNFRLQQQSPAYNTGQNNYIPTDIYDMDQDGNLSEIIDIDLDWGIRVEEAQVDMGAYERLLPSESNCHPEGSNLKEDLGEYCPGDPNLEFELTPTFENGMAHSSQYAYMFFVVENGFAVDRGTDLTIYEAGTYQICGLSYAVNYPQDVPEMNGTNTLQTIIDQTTDGTFCGAVSDNCATVHIVLNNNCCPEQEDVANKVVIADIICGEAAGNELGLPVVALEEIMADNFKAGQATAKWVQSEGPDVDLSDPANLLSLPNNSCDPITYRFDLEIGCTEDGDLALDGGYTEFTIYPLISLQPGNIIEGDLSCCPNMLLQCPDNYSLVNDYNGVEEAGNPTCDDSGQDKLFEFKIVLNNPPVTLEGSDCAAQAFKAVQTLSNCCPKEEDVDLINENVSICNEPTNTVRLPNTNLASNEYTTINWNQIGGTEVAIPEGDAPTLTLPQHHNCAPMSYTFELTIGCEVDEEVRLNGGSISYTIYSQPTIVEVAGCQLEAVADCPDAAANSTVLIEYQTVDGEWTSTPPTEPFNTGEQMEVRAYIENSPLQEGTPICVTNLTIETEDCCPQAAAVQPLDVVTDWCSTTEAITTTLSAEGVLTDLGATYSWEQITGEEVITIGEGASPEISLPANMDCTPKTYMFTLVIGCLFDETVALAGGIVTHHIYGKPAIVETEGCVLEVIADCPDEADPDLVVIEYNTGNGQWLSNPPIGPFESGEQITIRAYITNSPEQNDEPSCVTTLTIETEDCCPKMEDIQSVNLTESLCLVGATTTTVAVEGVQGVSGATYTWNQIAGEAIIPISAEATPDISLPVNTDCAPKTYTFALTIGCLFDEMVTIAGGTVTYHVYGPPPIIETAGCVLEVVADCPDAAENDLVTIEYNTSDGNWQPTPPNGPFEPGEQLDIRAYITNSPKQNGAPICMTVLTIETEDCCPKMEDVQRVELTESLCFIGEPSTTTLAVAGVQGVSGVTYNWEQITGEATIPIGATAAPEISLPVNTDCAPKTYTFALTIGCSFDETVALVGGTVTYHVYGSPTIAETAGCILEVVANCPDEGGNDLVTIEYHTTNGNWLNTPPSGPFDSGEQVEVRAYIANSPEQNEASTCMTYLTIETEHCCPKTEHIELINISEPLCFVGEPVTTTLAVEGIPNLSGATYTWNQITGEEIININTGASPEISLPVNTDCAPKTYTFALTIGCLFDETVAIIGGTVSYQIYSPPSIVVTEGCVVQVTPNCPVVEENDLVVIEYSNNGIAWTSEFLTESLESATTTHIRAYISGSPFVAETPICATQETIVTENCCPTPTQVSPIEKQLILCSETNGNQVLLSDEEVITANVEPTYLWQQMGESVTITIATGSSPEIQLPANNTCAPITYEFALTIGCLFDPTLVYNGGTLAIIQYPAPQMPSINRLTADIEEGCTYEIIPHCPDDILTPNTFEPVSLPTAGGKTTIQVKSSVPNSICETKAFEVPYEPCTICPLKIELTVTGGDNGGVTPFFYNTANLLVIGALTPFNYDWTHTGYVRPSIRTISETETMIEVVYAQDATWTVTITDQIGCSRVESNSPAEVPNGLLKIADFNITSTHPENNIGSIDIDIIGGISPYICDWHGPQGFEANTQSIKELRNGWYNVNITDQSVNEQGIAHPQSVTSWYWVPSIVVGDNDFVRGKEGAIEEAVAIQVFPNPITQQTNIQFVAPNTSQQTEVHLYSIGGQKIATPFRGATTVGQSYALELANQQLTNGIYIIALVNETGTISQTKLVVTGQ